VRWRRMRAISRGRDPATQAWEVRDTARDHGWLAPETETAREFAARASARVPSHRSGLADLADATDAAMFGADAIDEHAAVQAEAVAVAVRDTVHATVTKRRRILRQLDGRRLLNRRA